jgi:alpha-tubulin suppressor-like RCC1 family protein
VITTAASTRCRSSTQTRKKPNEFLASTPADGNEEGTANGPADYALWLDKDIVGVVEAKKVTPVDWPRVFERSACIIVDVMRVPKQRARIWLRELKTPAAAAVLAVLMQGCGGRAGASQPTEPGIPIALSAGGFHTCALLADGRVACWGDSFGGVDGGTRRFTPPVEVPGLTGVAAIASGEEQACALTFDGRVACWGWYTGVLGPESSPTPAFMARLKDVKDISAGGFQELGQVFVHTCALLSNGLVDCWGDDWMGQVGNGSFLSNSPVFMVGLPGVAEISAGGWHTCALLWNGTVECWGYNAEGQLGVDPTVDSNTCSSPAENGGPISCSRTPVRVSGVTDAIALSAGGDHTCVLRSDGTVLCWGDTVGDGAMIASVPSIRLNAIATPVAVPGLVDAIAIAAGGSFTCALRSDGTVVCWGNNTDGQLGDGTTTSRPTARPVTGLSGVVAISAGTAHTCALTFDGRVACWGADGDEELGSALPETVGACVPANPANCSTPPFSAVPLWVRFDLTP